MTMTDNFHSEKEHVREEMQRRLDYLSTEEMLSPSLKEQAMKVGIFRYSAGRRLGSVDTVGIERDLH